jgi:hypothetical protein
MPDTQCLDLLPTKKNSYWGGSHLGAGRKRKAIRTQGDNLTQDNNNNNIDIHPTALTPASNFNPPPLIAQSLAPCPPTGPSTSFTGFFRPHPLIRTPTSSIQQPTSNVQQIVTADNHPPHTSEFFNTKYLKLTLLSTFRCYGISGIPHTYPLC